MKNIWLRTIAFLFGAVLSSCRHTDSSTAVFTPEDAVRVYYESWQAEDSIRLSSVIDTSHARRLVGKYYSLFSHNPTEISLVSITRSETVGDSLAFVDALIRVPAMPSADSVSFMLQKFDHWRVIIQSSMWQQIDRF